MVELIDPRDLAFQLYEVLEVHRLTERARYAEHDRATFDAVIETAGRLAEEVFAPHAATADAHEPKVVDGEVVLIPEVRTALDAFIAAGFMTAAADVEMGGQQLPHTVAQAAYALFQAANVGTMGYPFLTIAAANLLRSFGSPAQHDRYMRPMLEGRYFGTMCLSEPHAGSGLADIRTTAYPQADGTYKLKGTKMWISAGCHELTENIVHLVLARIDGAPAGVKGISLFAVPRYRLGPTGDNAGPNDVVLAGLNHKMGYRGTVNTLLNFGENDDCVGELIGEPHHGLGYMFQMMNEARIGVGLGAVALGSAGYRYALDYARTRPQGRHPDEKDPASKPIALIAHADVRRMLLAQKVYVEGCLGLGLYTARLVDDCVSLDDDKAVGEANLLLDILTPIMKAWSSDYCLKANDLAIQVLGGYGYTRDYPVERYYRDNRLNPIHEGTNGIQAIDLLGRKAVMKNGAALQLLGARIAEEIGRAAAFEVLKPHAEALEKALGTVTETTMALVGLAGREGPRAYLANASVYLDMVGRVVIAWMWLAQARAAQAALADGHGEQPAAFYRGKLQACRYMFVWELPRIDAQAALLKAGDTTTLAMEDAWF